MITQNRTLTELYKDKRVLVTGHTGFKGSWLSKWLQMLGAEVYGYALPPNTDPSHFSLLETDMASGLSDIRDLSMLRKATAEARPDIIFHLAAQPFVRLSYKYPIQTFSTNIEGTINILESARLCKPKGVVIITSDKCYRNKEWCWPYREEDELGGYDPYSASKACAEIVSRSYHESFLRGEGVIVASTRAGNVIGGGDWGEDRLIPDMMRAYSKGDTAIVRNPSAIRPWQYVLDVLYGYLLLGSHILCGEDVSGAWNFGPVETYSVSVGDLVRKIAIMLPGFNYKHSEEEGPKESSVLRLDSSKARALLGWYPRMDVYDALWETVDWYKAYYKNGVVDTEYAIEEYTEWLEHTEEL